MKMLEISDIEKFVDRAVGGTSRGIGGIAYDHW